jgi:hypothetical protein
MKTKFSKLIVAPVLLALAIHNSQFSTASAQGTAFTYEGQLQSSNGPVTGSYNFTFTLFAINNGGAAIAGPATNSSVNVSNGLFTVLVDFGPGVFVGSSNWLEIAVETNGAGSFNTLSPRQQLTPVPYAIFAEGASNVVGIVPSGALSGTYGSAVTFSNAGDSFTGNGAGLTGVNATTLNGYGYCSLPCYWNLTGNAGTTPGTDFVGTTDNEPLELHIDGSRAFRLEPNSSGAPNVIGGAAINYVFPGDVGSTIGGGGAADFLGNAGTNSAIGNFVTIGGGLQNEVENDYGTVGGGVQNLATLYSTVAGGRNNNAQAAASTVGGGEQNAANGNDSTVGGGYLNTASGVYATVPGGYTNLASGLASFAAGYGASANNNNTFVWSDGTAVGNNFSSTAANQFLIHASGGVGIGTNNTTGAPLRVVGSREGDSSQATVILENMDTTSSSSSALRVVAHGGPTQGALSVSTGWGSGTGATNILIAQFGNANAYVSQLDNNGNWTATTFNGSSDRNAKENFSAISPTEILSKVVALPISRWNYKVDKNSEHIGPMAQDFHAAFSVGLDDKHVATVDEEGVALAAIQGLDQELQAQTAKMNAKDAQIQTLEQQNEALEQRLDNLEQVVKSMEQKN